MPRDLRFLRGRIAAGRSEETGTSSLEFLDVHYLFAAIFVLALVATPLPQAESSTENSFISRFAGNWTGNGHVQKDARSNTWRVSCRVNGQPGFNRISINGTCNAAVMVSRRIGADLVYDPATGRYSGTYVGSKAGPANLHGSRSGNAVRLTITWPKPVNGDTKARMTVHNDGSGNLRITVADNLEPGGPIKTTSEIILSH